jgi:hypothetical protein
MEVRTGVSSRLTVPFEGRGTPLEDDDEGTAGGLISAASAPLKDDDEESAIGLTEEVQLNWPSEVPFAKVVAPPLDVSLELTSALVGSKPFVSVTVLAGTIRCTGKTGS